MRQLYLITAGLLLLGVCITMRAIGAAPAHGWSTPCKIVEVYDGDTITVEITKRVRVRLAGAWAPEVTLQLPPNPTAKQRAEAAAEKNRGIASRDHLRAMAENCNATLFIKASERGMLGDEWTMSRVIGQVWLTRSDGTSDEDSLSDIQVRGGFATRSKQ